MRNVPWRLPGGALVAGVVCFVWGVALALLAFAAPSCVDIGCHAISAHLSFSQ